MKLKVFVLMLVLPLAACTNQMKAASKGEQALLSASVFAPSVTGTCPGGDGVYPNCGQTQQPQQPQQPEQPQTQPQEPQQPPQTQQPPQETTPPPAVPVSCKEKMAAFEGLVKKNLTNLTGQTNMGIGSNCQRQFADLSATTRNSAGQALSSTSGANVTIGFGCSNYALILDRFGSESLRGEDFSGKMIDSVSICKQGLDNCSSASSGYIADIKWETGSYSDNLIKGITLAGGTTISKAEIACAGDADVQSPLIIEDQKGQGITTLDPFATHTYFDLLGDGAKSRISCIAEGSFLVLPNARGEIVNINQLFGNHTLGPDGNKADNGFEALAKYDDDHDNMISRKDRVFSKLKLWKDDNCDGKAEARELYTLAERDISAIKTSYRPMKQVDRFGNETLQRSFVVQGNGDLMRIFDLWFKPY